jgi:hypothetical protein
MPDFSNLGDHAIMQLGMMAARVVINGSTDYSDWEFVPYGRHNGECVNRCIAIMHAIHTDTLSYNEEWTDTALTPLMREVKYWGIFKDTSGTDDTKRILTFTSKHEAAEWFMNGDGRCKELHDQYYPNVFESCRQYGVDVKTVWNKEEQP